MTTREEVTALLGRACGADAVRAAGPGDAVGGREAKWVVAPPDTKAVAAALTVCAAQDLTVVPRGEGGKLNWGNSPSRVDVLVDMGRLAGVYRHDPDDQVAIVGAGTPLRAVQAALGKHGQRLAVDPGSAEATIGGILATGEAGPLRLGFGPPRDLLIGVEFVRADGTVARSGGRVVKNVAGYDLGKLLSGSYGTLGLITSATFRVHPVPAARAFVTAPVAAPAEAHDIVRALLATTLSPAAIELDLPVVEATRSARTKAGPTGAGPTGAGPTGAGPTEAGPTEAGPTESTASGQITVLLEGTAAGVAARAQEASTAMHGGTVSADPPPWWGRYPFVPGDVALKIVAPVADLHATLYALRDAAGTAVSVRGSAGVGVCYAALPGTPPLGRTARQHAERVSTVLSALRTTLLGRNGSCTVLDAPREIREVIDMWGPVNGLFLMRAVKSQFDPRRRLSPGRFVGGI